MIKEQFIVTASFPMYVLVGFELGKKVSARRNKEGVWPHIVITTTEDKVDHDSLKELAIRAASQSEFENWYREGLLFPDAEGVEALPFIPCEHRDQEMTDE